MTSLIKSYGGEICKDVKSENEDSEDDADE